MNARAIAGPARLRDILNRFRTIGFYGLMAMVSSGFVGVHLLPAQPAEARGRLDLIRRAEASLYVNPPQTLNIAHYLIAQNREAEDNSEIFLLIARANVLKGDYSAGLKNAFLSLENAQKRDNTNLVRRSRLFIAGLLTKIGLQDIAETFLSDAAERPRPSEDVSAELMDAWHYEAEDKTDSAAAVYTNILNEIMNSAHQQTPEMTGNLLEAGYDLSLLRINSGETAGLDTLLHRLDQMGASETNAGYFRMIRAMIYGYLYADRGEEQLARDSLSAALDIAVQLDNNIFRAQIAGHLATLALKQDDIETFRTYHQEALIRDEGVDRQRHSARAEAVHLITGMRKKAHAGVVSDSKIRNAILIAILAMVLVILLLQHFRYRTRIRHYREILLYLKLVLPRRKPIPHRVEKPKVEVKTRSTQRRASSQISPEIEEKIERLLEKFESGTDFNDREMSLARLSAAFGVNSKYLSAIIHKIKGKNYNQYINHLRINYVIEKLKTDEQYRKYKLAYIAEKTGFSSHSNFATVFKQVAGLSPARFIALLESDKAKA